MKKLIFLLIPSFIFINCKVEDNNTPIKTTEVASMSKKYEISQKHNSILDSSITIDDILGKVVYENDKRFINIPGEYADSDSRYMLEEAFLQYKKMHKAAKKEGLDLKIVSAARNFDDQKRIWERKWNGQTTLSNGMNLAKVRMNDEQKARMILLYSSMPGTSRHHWGTDIDINDVEEEYFEGAKGQREYEWLDKNASKYGFCQVYSEKGENRPNGYEEEKWHWSYMPIADKYLAKAKEELNYEMISGFDGSHTAKQLQVIEHYIGGIEKNCNQWH